MVVLSVLRAASARSSPLIGKIGAFRPGISAGTVCVRGMGGHGHKMVIKPSQYDWTIFKDKIYFFTVLGLLPMGVLIFLVNTFIGQAELADLPEDYEPKHWEYHKSPISRFLAQYMYSNPQKEYEKTLHMVNLENEKAKLRRLEAKVRILMAERGDYKGWYYLPGNQNRVYLAREVEERRRQEYGQGPV